MKTGLRPNKIYKKIYFWGGAQNTGRTAGKALREYSFHLYIYIYIMKTGLRPNKIYKNIYFWGGAQNTYNDLLIKEGTASEINLSNSSSCS